MQALLIASAADVALPLIKNLPPDTEMVVYENGGWTLEFNAPEGSAIAIAPADIEYKDTNALIGALNETVPDELADRE